MEVENDGSERTLLFLGFIFRWTMLVFGGVMIFFQAYAMSNEHCMKMSKEILMFLESWIKIGIYTPEV